MEEFIASKKGDSYKKKLVDAYALYCRFKRLKFEKPRYKGVVFISINTFLRCL